jgi:hypothetical protein
VITIAFADVPRLAAILTRCQDTSTQQLGSELERLLAQPSETSALWAVGLLIPQALVLVQRAALHGDAAAQQLVALMPRWDRPLIEPSQN